ncbi:unnamed protein product, partial [Meganyctiphanes norvegica]
MSNYNEGEELLVYQGPLIYKAKCIAIREIEENSESKGLQGWGELLGMLNWNVELCVGKPKKNTFELDCSTQMNHQDSEGGRCHTTRRRPRKSNKKVGVTKGRWGASANRISDSETQSTQVLENDPAQGGSQDVHESGDSDTDINITIATENAVNETERGVGEGTSAEDGAGGSPNMTKDIYEEETDVPESWEL